jgi:hypothetical protein
MAAATVGAHFEAKPLAPEKSAAQFDTRRLDDAGLKKFVTTNSGGELKNWPSLKWDLNSLMLGAFFIFIPLSPSSVRSGADLRRRKSF